MADLALETSLRPARPTGPAGIRFLLTRLALQNLGRRTGRTALLVMAVAICAGAILTGVVLLRSIEGSMAVGFTRLGADMLVVPQGTLTNITAALLTAEPTELTFDDAMLGRLSSLKGIRRIAPQLVFRTEASGYGPADEPVDIIAFDPARDLTVQPWLELSPRPAAARGRRHHRRPPRGAARLGDPRLRQAADRLRQARQIRGRHPRARTFHRLRHARRPADHHAADLRQEGAARAEQALRRARRARPRRDRPAGPLRDPRQPPGREGRSRTNRC